MEVEVYDVTAQETTNPEEQAKVVTLCRELGLEGQLAMLGQREAGDGDSVETIKPFRQMTAEEQRVYGVLFPKAMTVQEYDRGPIPFRVLAVIALCHQNEWYPDGLVIWCPESLQDKDPILLGKLEKYGKYDLLARWGEALEDFDTLKARAVKQWITERKAGAQRIIATLDADAVDYFSGRFVSTSV